MLKRYISIAFVFIACNILLLHSFIPHHHHDEESSEHQNKANDDDHDDINNNFLAHAFSFQHHDNGAIIFETNSQVSKLLKTNAGKEVFLQVNYIVGIVHKPPLIHSGQPLLQFIPAPFTCAAFLRGPPAPLG